MSIDTVRVAVGFVADTAKGKFSDTLYFTQDEFATLKPDELEAMKTSRIDNWLALVAKSDVPLTKEQLQDWAGSVDAQLADLTVLKSKLESDIGKLP